MEDDWRERGVCVRLRLGLVVVPRDRHASASSKPSPQSCCTAGVPLNGLGRGGDPLPSDFVSARVGGPSMVGDPASLPDNKRSKNGKT